MAFSFDSEYAADADAAGAYDVERIPTIVCQVKHLGMAERIIIADAQRTVCQILQAFDAEFVADTDNEHAVTALSGKVGQDNVTVGKVRRHTVTGDRKTGTVVRIEVIGG